MIRISVVVLVLAVLLAFAPCCGKGEGDITPGPGVTPTPEVTSYRFQIEATQIEDGEEITALTTGEAIVDRFHVRTVASDGTDEETIHVGDKMYSRADDGPWEVIDFPSQCWTCSVRSGIGHFMDTIVDAEVVGEEEVNGVLTVHIKGRTDMAAKAKQTWPDYDTADPEEWQEQFLAGTEHMDFWLGKEDKLLRKMRVQTALPAVANLDAYSADATFSYWDYNAEIVIEAPVIP